MYMYIHVHTCIHVRGASTVIILTCSLALTTWYGYVVDAATTLDKAAMTM